MSRTALRWIIGLVAIAALGWSLLRAPFEYRGFNDIDRMQNGQSVRYAAEIAGLHYAPIWSVPTSDSVSHHMADRRMGVGFKATKITLSGTRIAVRFALVIGLALLAAWGVQFVAPAGATASSPRGRSR